MNLHIIKKPIITEKSIVLAKSENKYTFKVDRLANKDQVKQAIEEMFGVNVLAVNTIRSHRVRRATGRKRMRTVIAATKKAIVELKKGQTIDFFEFGSTEETK
jgi:large subunit ribosomal protein L23